MLGSGLQLGRKFFLEYLCLLQYPGKRPDSKLFMHRQRTTDRTICCLFAEDNMAAALPDLLKTEFLENLQGLLPGYPGHLQAVEKRGVFQQPAQELHEKMCNSVDWIVSKKARLAFFDTLSGMDLSLEGGEEGSGCFAHGEFFQIQFCRFTKICKCFINCAPLADCPHFRAGCYIEVFFLVEDSRENPAFHDYSPFLLILSQNTVILFKNPPQG